MKKAILYCHDKLAKFTETYVEGERASFPIGTTDIDAWAAKLIANFNATLRPGEHKRTLDRIEVSDVDERSVRLSHDWHKTNAVTISDKHGIYDAMRCDQCGITGKRFGLEGVTRDKAFKAEAFDTCNGAKRLLEKRRAKKVHP